jgi:hypothetical protein
MAKLSLCIRPFCTFDSNGGINCQAKKFKFIPPSVVDFFELNGFGIYFRLKQKRAQGDAESAGLPEMNEHSGPKFDILRNECPDIWVGFTTFERVRLF